MSYNPYSLEGKTILITGASSGIGRITAIECSKMGATVIITGRNKERLNETFEKIENKSKQHIQLQFDLSKTEDIELLVAQIPIIDGCVNNAGITSMHPVAFFSKEIIENMFSVNAFAPMLLTKQLIKRKKINKNSSIVFTSSAEGVFGVTLGNGLYGATKSAINSYMQSAALELARKGIRCNSVNPSMVKTNMATSEGAFSKEQLNEDVKRYPLGRYGEPKDIALAIIYLLSDASSWVTGTALKIDGGRTLNM